MRGGDRRGAALILVLVLLVVLGLIATEVGRAARLETGIVANIRARTVARYAAEGGVLAARVSIERMLDSATSFDDRRAAFADLGARLRSLEEVDLGDTRFGVVVVDLNARIDLNRTDAEVIRGFLGRFSGPGRATPIVAALGAAPLRRLGEFAMIPGVDDALALAVASYVTVSSDGRINVNSAPEAVLAAVPAIGDDGARSILARRQAGELVAALPTLLKPAASSGASSDSDVESLRFLTTSPSRLLVIARGWGEGHPLTHEIQAVYAIAGPRLVLQSWQERDL